MGINGQYLKKVIQDAVLKVCNEESEFSNSLEIDGIICVAIDDQQEDVVVKIHRTIIRPSKKNQTIREARDDVHHDPRCTTNPCSNASSSVQYNTQFTSPPDASTRRTVQSPQSNDRKRKQYSPDQDTHTQKTIKIEEPEIIEEDLTGDTDLDNSSTYYNHHSARNALDPTINDNVKHKPVEGIEYALEESEPNISLNKTQAQQMSSIKQDQDLYSYDMLMDQLGNTRVKMEQSNPASQSTSLEQSNSTEQASTVQERYPIQDEQLENPNFNTMVEQHVPLNQSMILEQSRIPEQSMMSQSQEAISSFQKPKVKPEHQFTCDLCLKTFKRLSELTRHQKFHLGDRPHQCTLCSSSFVLRQDLNRHLKSVHKMLKREALE